MGKALSFCILPFWSSILFKLKAISQIFFQSVRLDPIRNPISPIRSNPIRILFPSPVSLRRLVSEIIWEESLSPVNGLLLKPPSMPVQVTLHSPGPPPVPVVRRHRGWLAPAAHSETAFLPQLVLFILTAPETSPRRVSAGSVVDRRAACVVCARVGGGGLCVCVNCVNRRISW